MQFQKKCLQCDRKLRYDKGFVPCVNLDYLIEKIIENTEDKQVIEQFQQRQQENKQYNKNKKINQFEVGQKIDIRSPEYIWCIGVIKKIYFKTNRQKYLINFPSIYDEEFLENSQRIAPYQFYTSRDDIPKLSYSKQGQKKITLFGKQFDFDFIGLSNKKNQMKDLAQSDSSYEIEETSENEKINTDNQFLKYHKTIQINNKMEEYLNNKKTNDIKFRFDEFSQFKECFEKENIFSIYKNSKIIYVPTMTRKLSEALTSFEEDEISPKITQFRKRKNSCLSCIIDPKSTLQCQKYSDEERQNLILAIKSNFVNWQSGQQYHFEIASLVYQILSNNKESFKPLKVSKRYESNHENTIKNDQRSQGSVFGTNFNLYENLLNDPLILDFFNLQQFKEIFKPPQTDQSMRSLYKKKAIKKYKYKKGRRQKTTKIRYKIRKELAEKRKRVNGKFVKSKKIDLKDAIEKFQKNRQFSNNNAQIIFMILIKKSLYFILIFYFIHFYL